MIKGAFDFGIHARSSVIPVPTSLATMSAVFTDDLLLALEEAYRLSHCRVRGLLMSNPHNPLGQCFPKVLLEKCLRFCNDRGIHFISDEVYSLTSFSCSDIPEPVPFNSILSIDLRKTGFAIPHVSMLFGVSVKTLDSADLEL